MKKILFGSLATLLLLVLFISGCKQDIDLTSDYKEVPVVYGLLNTQDATHYIRVQKGYLIDGDAYAAAGIPDSIYYSDSLVVRLIPYTGANAGNPIVFTKRVNTVVKDSGTFATTPHILYAYTGTLDPSKSYKLQIINTTSKDTFSSAEQTGIALVKDFQVVSPNQDLIGANVIGLSSNAPYTIRWRAADNAGIYDIKMRFPYREYDNATNTLQVDSFVEVYILKSESGIVDNTFLIASFNPLLLLNTLANNLEVRNDRYRIFKATEGIKLYFTAGGTTLAQFINAQKAQSGGLTSNEALPPYTNITDGVGIFSSRYSKTLDSIMLTNAALDTLSCHPITAPLRFRGSNGQVCF